MARVTLSTDVLGDDEPPARSSTPPPPPPPVAQEERPRKFTMLVGPADDERARRVTDEVVRLAGIRPTKSMRADVLRVLVALADEDPRLRQRAAKALREL